MKRLFAVLVLSCVNILLVQGQLQYRQTGSGLNFNIVDDKPGATAKVGQLVSLHMQMQDENGKMIKDTYKDGKPLMFPVKLSAFEGDVYEAISLLSKGDSALFQLKADSMYIKVFRKPVPSNVTGNSYLNLNVKVFNVWDQKTYYDSLKAASKTEVSSQELDRRKNEKVKIDSYCKSKGYEMQKTEGGVYYIYFSEGNGESIAKDGNTIVMNFIGELLNGNKFETTFNEDGIGRPISFVLGKEEVIPGWDEVLKGKKEGDKLFVIVPSHLAFGSQSKGNQIPENSPLVFNIDVMGVR